MKLDICDWLRTFLKDGPRDVNDVRAAAKSAGYTKGELREAKRICFIAVTNNRSRNHPRPDHWFWSLPKEDEV